MEQTKRGKVVVTGSFITDIAVFTSRFPADGETVPGRSIQFGPGGKGSNQATAASRAGAEVIMITKIGTDFMGEIARTHYKNEIMTQKYVFTQEGGETGSAIIEINAETAENRIIVLKGANDALTKEEIDQAEAEFQECDVLLTQLEASQISVLESIRLARRYGKTVVLNPAPAGEIDEALFGEIDYFTPNETEAEFYTGIRVTDEQTAERAADRLLDKGVKNVIITLGKIGVYAKTKEFQGIVPAFRVKAVDTTGAGDAFNGGFCAALAEGKSVRDAVLFANALAALSVTRRGTSPAMPYRGEIEKMLKGEC